MLPALWITGPTCHLDCPRDLGGAIQYVGAALKKVPDLRVSIEDLIAEDDKVVVGNHWTGTDRASGIFSES